MPRANPALDQNERRNAHPAFDQKKRRNPNDFSWQLFSDDEMTALRASDLAAEVTRNGAPLNVIADGRRAAADLGFDPSQVTDEQSSMDMQDQALRAKFSSVAKVFPETGRVMQDFSDAILATREVNTMGRLEAVGRGFQRGASRLFSNAWYNSQLMFSRAKTAELEKLLDLRRPKESRSEESEEAPSVFETYPDELTPQVVARGVWANLFGLSDEDIEERISYLKTKQSDTLEKLVFARDHADRKHDRHRDTIRIQEEMSEFHSETFLDSLTNHLGLIGREPIGVTQWAFETLAESGTPLVLGAGAAAAAAPLGIPVSGALIAGSISATGSYTQARASMEEELTLNFGYDLRTREGRAALIADPDFIKETYSKSFRYGAMIGLMDGASHGVASRTLVPDILENYIGKKGIAHGLVNGVAHSFAQGVMGGGGEALGLLAAEEHLDWDRVVQEAIPDFLTGVPGAAFYGGFDGVASVRSARKRLRLLHEIKKVAENSETVKADAEQGAELTQKILSGVGLGSMRIEAKVLREIFNGKQPPGAFTEEAFFSIIKSADFEEYQNALAKNTGGDVIIDSGEYLAHVAGTDLDRAINKSLRFEAGDLTQAEADDVVKDIQKKLEEEDKKTEEKKDDSQDDQDDSQDDQDDSQDDQEEDGFRDPIFDAIEDAQDPKETDEADDYRDPIFDAIEDAQDPKETVEERVLADYLEQRDDELRSTDEAESAKDREREAFATDAKVLNDERERLVAQVMDARGFSRVIAESQVEPLISFARTMAKRHKLPVSDFLARFPLPIIGSEVNFDPNSEQHIIEVDSYIEEATEFAALDESAARKYRTDFPKKSRLVSKISELAGNQAPTQDNVIDAVAALRGEGFVFFDVHPSLRRTRPSSPSLASIPTDRVVEPTQESLGARSRHRYFEGLKLTEEGLIELVYYGNTPVQEIPAGVGLGANEGDATSGVVESGGFRKVIRLDPKDVYPMHADISEGSSQSGKNISEFLGLSNKGGPDGLRMSVSLLDEAVPHQVIPTDAAASRDYARALKRFRNDHRMEKNFRDTFFKGSSVVWLDDNTPRVAQRIIDKEWSPLTLYATDGVQPGFGQEVEQVFMRVENPLRFEKVTHDVDLLPTLHRKLEKLRNDKETAGTLTEVEKANFDYIANADGDTGVDAEKHLVGRLTALGFDGIATDNRFAAFTREQFQPIMQMESDTQSEAAYGDHFLSARDFIELFGKSDRESGLPTFTTLDEAAKAARDRVVRELPLEQAAHDLADSLVAASGDYAGFSKLLSEAQSGDRSVQDTASLFEVYAGRRDLAEQTGEALTHHTHHPSVYSALEYAWAQMLDVRKQLTRSERKELLGYVNAAGEIAIKEHSNPERESAAAKLEAMTPAIDPGRNGSSHLVRAALSRLGTLLNNELVSVTQDESTHSIKTAAELDGRIVLAFKNSVRKHGGNNESLKKIRERYHTYSRRQGPNTTDKTRQALSDAIGPPREVAESYPDFMEAVDRIYQDTEFLLQPFQEQGATRTGEFEALPLGLEDQLEADTGYDAAVFNLVHKDHMKRVLELVKTKFPGAEITNEETTHIRGERVKFSGSIHDNDKNRTALYHASRSYYFANKDISASVSIDRDEVKGLGVGADWLSTLALFFERMSDNTGAKHNMSAVGDGVLVWILKGYLPSERSVDEVVWSALMRALETDNKEDVRAAITDGSIKQHADAIKQAFTDANINTWYSTTPADRVIELHANPNITANETVLYSVKDDRGLIREAQKAHPIEEAEVVKTKSDVDIVSEQIKLVEDGSVTLPITIPETERRLAWVEETGLHIEDAFYAGYSLESDTGTLIPPTAPPTFYFDAAAFQNYDYASGELLRLQEQRFAPNPVAQVSIRGRFVRQTDLRDYVKDVRGVSDLNVETVEKLVAAGVSGVTHDVGNSLNLILFDANNVRVFESETDSVGELTGDRRIHRDERQFTPVADRIPYGLRSSMAGRTEEFGKWFYKSVVKSRDGSPLLVDGSLGLLKAYKAATKDTQAGRYVSIQRPKRIKMPRHGLAGVLQGARVDLNVNTEADYRAFLAEIGTDPALQPAKDTDFSAKSMLEAFDHGIRTTPLLEAFIRSRLLPTLLSKFTEQGFDGFIHTFDSGETLYIPFSGAQVKTASNPEIWLYQPEAGDGRLSAAPTSPTGVKGLTRMQRDPADKATPVIHLFETADFSTLLHETAHYMDVTLQKMADSGSKYAIEERRVIEDWLVRQVDPLAKSAGLSQDKILEYFRSGRAGQESDQVHGPAIKEHIHEAIAEGFEKYLREGKAPSDALARVFETFARWLTGIYRYLRSIGRTQVILDPDIRGVFDRMLAADDEIRARIVDGSPQHLGQVVEVDLDQSDRDKLQAIHDGVIDVAHRTLRERVLRDNEDVQKGLNDVVAARVRQEERERLREKPINRVVAWLSHDENQMEKKWVATQSNPSPPAFLARHLKMDMDDLIASYGEDVLQFVARKNDPDRQGRKRNPTPLYTKDTGVQADDIADIFKGDPDNPAFTDGADLISQLRLLPTMSQQLEAAVRTRMSLAVNPKAPVSLEEEADDAMVNRRRADLIIEELKYLNRMANRDGSPTFRKETKDAAREELDKKPTHVAIQSHVYRALEARHANAALRAAINKEFDKAVEHKQAQMYQFELFMQSRAIRSDKEKLDRLVRRLSNRKAFKNLDPDTFMTSAIREIIYNVELRRDPKNREARTTDLARVVERLKEEGEAIRDSVPESVSKRKVRVEYHRLPSRQMRDVYKGLTNLIHIVRESKRIKIDEETLSKEKVIQTLAERADIALPNVKLDRIRNPKDRKKDPGRDAYNLVQKADTLLMRFDNWEANGPFYRTFKLDIDRAGIVAQKLREHASVEFRKMFGVYERDEMIEYSKRKVWPSSTHEMSRFDLISMALNTGNTQNFHRLTDPNNRPTQQEIDKGGPQKEKLSFTETEVNGLLSVLTEKDWTLVQSIWDYFEREFWPKIYERETRLTGLAPEKVVAQPMVKPNVAGMTLRGGYYPVIYDPDRTANVGDDTNKELAEALMTGRYGKAQTRNGHTKERLKGAGGKVLFIGIEALFSHTNRVIHDLAFGEPLSQAWNMLQNGKVRKIFENKGKVRDLRALEVWAQDVAAGQAGGSHIGAGFLRSMKTGFVVSKLAFNVLTAVSQFTGATQTAALIGKRNTVMGYSEAWANFKAAQRGNPEALEIKSEFMSKRRETFHRDMLDIMTEMQTNPIQSRGKEVQWWAMQIGFYPMQMVQFHVVDRATWYGARLQAEKLGMSESEQIAHADRMVAQSQASGLYADRSAVERGTLGLYNRQNEFVRLFTALMSYTLAKMNVTMITWGRMMRGIKDKETNTARAAFTGVVDLLLLYALEGTLYALLSQGWPEFEDDDNVLKESGLYVAKHSALTFLSGIPLIKDLASVTQGYAGGGTYGSVLETFGRVVSAGLDVASDADSLLFEGEWGDKTTVQDLRPVLDVAGLLWPGVPSTQLWRIFSGFGFTGDEPSMTGIILGR